MKLPHFARGITTVVISRLNLCHCHFGEHCFGRTEFVTIVVDAYTYTNSEYVIGQIILSIHVVAPSSK